MNLKKDRFNQLIRDFKLRELFNELGWDNVKKKESVIIDEEKYELDAVAEKRNFLIFVCSPDQSGKIPNQNIRRKIDNKISKLYFEHLIIYHDTNNSQQLWQLVIREQGKPISLRETPYFSTQTPELLYQKLRGLFFAIDDEEKISLVDVKSNVLEQFNTNAEKVTKKFYERFQNELKSFQKFIEGIEDKVDKEWYASLMLNRLMFIYFIQKKGFLDNNINYLYDKLKYTKQHKGKNKFYSFYKDFLLVLFHQGLGSPNHSRELEEELGKIPYLNGGLFEVHQLEEKNKKINIDDNAFEKIFDFFDEYNWHLDNRPASSGKDINPDVIGYIFEKYINDRAAMGAYYTKEDITEYISKNTIIPFLFDDVKKECANAFRDESSLWKMLSENPDRYIYDAVRHGIYFNSEERSDEESQNTIRPLPPEIQKGINPAIEKQIVKDVDKNSPQLLELRKEWNKSAPEEYALPTEIWREVVERRNRYFDIKNKIESGEIKEINDFITYNFDIRQFAQDAVEQYEGSDFINAFYKAVTNISVLDPTCGSGAFLFAALNILEPIYETCISRMRGFIEEDDKVSGKKHSAFRNVIEEIKHHPNEKYFIYKSIILKNLFGVDIMNEATEIAKLRLFLKLVAEVEVDYKKDNFGLEPLPDIDFNIRCGNTLVGFAKAEDVDKSVEGSFDATFLKDEIKKIKEEAEEVSMAFHRYKDVQLIIDKNSEQHSEAKSELNNRLKSLNDKLNLYQARLYGIETKKKKEYETWKNSHQPFHWFAEFYEIMNEGGFDIIIGNPPYIENAKVFKNYITCGYLTIDSGNIYTQIVERGRSISRINSLIGWIVPISAVCTDRTESFQKFISDNYSRWVSSFDIFPSRLFNGAAQRLSILLLLNSKKERTLFVTKYYRWYENERTNLIHKLSYIPNNNFAEIGWLARINNIIGFSILNKLPRKKIVNFIYSPNETIIYVHRIINNFVKAISFEPYFKKSSGEVTHSDDFKKLESPKKYQELNTALLNSNLFYFYWRIHGDGFHCGFKDIEKFPADLLSLSNSNSESIKVLSINLVKDLKKNSERRIRNQEKTGRVELQTFFVGKSKTLIDEIDKILAEHYGFTEEELDFIINYDIKYRMGKELEEE